MSSAFQCLYKRAQNVLIKAEIRTSIQTFTAFFILLAALSTPSVWSALSLVTSNVTPVYAAVSLSVVLQPNVGTALSFTIQRLIAAAIGGGLGLVCMYITYLANGSSYQTSTTKGVVMCIISPIFGFFLAMGAYRFPRFWFGFIVGGVCLPIVALSGFHLSTIQPLVMPYFLMEVAIGIAVAAVVSICILPVTTGRTITSNTVLSLRKLGEGTVELGNLLLLPTLQSAARNNQKTGDDDENFFTEKFPAIPPDKLESFIETYTEPISSALVKAKAQLVPVTTEIDIYHRPLIFPRHGYGTLLALLRHYLSTLMILTYLAEGEAPLGALFTLKSHLDGVVGAIKICFEALAEILEERQDGGMKYPAALEKLNVLEEKLLELSVFKVPWKNPVTKKPFTESEIVIADTVIAVVFSLGSRVRRLYFTIPESYPEDHVVWNAWKQHFKGQKWDFEIGSPRQESGSLSPASPLARQTYEVKSPLTQHYINQLNTPRAKSLAIPISRRESIATPSPGKEGLAQKSDGKVVVETALPPPVPAYPTTKQKIDVTNSKKGNKITILWSTLRDLENRHLFWSISGENLILSLQVKVALLAATILHVCDASYNALGQRTIWAVVTVAVLAQRSVGGVVLRGLNRVMGTIAGGATGIGLLYWVYLLNGLSYENYPAKFIVMTIFLALILAAVMYFSMKSSAHFAYSWMVWKITLPIIALVGYNLPDLPLGTALWRLLNIAIGLALDLAASTLIFPISTRNAMKRRICSVIDNLADIAAGTSSKLLAAASLRSQQSSMHQRETSLSFITNFFSSEPSTSTTITRRLSLQSSKSAFIGGISSSRPQTPSPPMASPLAGANSSTNYKTTGLPPNTSPTSASPRQPITVEEQGQSATTTDAPLPDVHLHIRTRTEDQPPANPIQSPFAGPGAANMVSLSTFTSPSSPPSLLPSGGEKLNPSRVSPTASEFYVVSPTAKHDKTFIRQRTKWMEQTALGRNLLQLRTLGTESAELLSALAELELVAEFEEKTLEWPIIRYFYSIDTFNRRRVGHEDMVSARRALRRMLNALLSFAYIIDGPDIPHLKVLVHHRPSVDAVMIQMAECLQAVAGVAQKKLSFDRLVLTQTNLTVQVQELVLQIEKTPSPVGCTQADVVLGFASVGLLVAAVQTLGEVSDAVVNVCLLKNELEDIQVDMLPPLQSELGTTDEGSGDGNDEKYSTSAARGAFGSTMSLHGGNHDSEVLSGGNTASRKLRWTGRAQVLLSGISSMGRTRSEKDEDEDVEMAKSRFQGQGSAE